MGDPNFTVHQNHQVPKVDSQAPGREEPWEAVNFVPTWAHLRHSGNAPGMNAQVLPKSISVSWKQVWMATL